MESWLSPVISSVPCMDPLSCGALAPELKGSVVVVSRFSCPRVYIGKQFPDQGINRTPMYCKAGS